MELLATKDVGRNIQAGVVYDYPMPTWNHILKNSKYRKLSSFTQPVDEAVKSGRKDSAQSK